MILARQQIEVRSPVEATIESVKVRRGDLVMKGQVLATLESGPERAALALAQSRAQMQGEIKVAEARVELTQKKLQRAEELYKQKFVSSNARDEAEAVSSSPRRSCAAPGRTSALRSSRRSAPPRFSDCEHSEVRLRESWWR